MSRKQKALEKYKDNKTLVEEIFNLDPNQGAYSDWALRETLKTPENKEKIVEYINIFHNKKNTLASDKRDLYSYKSFDQLKKELDSLAPSNRKKKKEGYTLIKESSKAKFYEVHDYNGIKALGADTKWCITQEQHWKSYTENQNYIFFILVSNWVEDKAKDSKFALSFRVNDNKKYNNRNFYDSTHNLYERLRNDLWAYQQATNNTKVSYTWHDAKDRQWYDDYDGVNIIDNYIDLLLEEKGFISKFIKTISGELTLMPPEIAKEMRVLLDDIRWGNRDKILECAKRGSDLELFNPLSLLFHKKIKSQKACKEIWDMATYADKCNLGWSNMKKLSSTYIINNQDYLDKIVNEFYGANKNEVLVKILSSKKSTKKTKKYIANYLTDKYIK